MNQEKDIERLFRQHYQEMLHLARCILGDGAEAKDAVADVDTRQSLTNGFHDTNVFAKYNTGHSQLSLDYTLSYRNNAKYLYSLGDSLNFQVRFTPDIYTWFWRTNWDITATHPQRSRAADAPSASAALRGFQDN